MKKTVFIGLLIIVLAFGFIGCDPDNSNGGSINSAVWAQLQGEWEKDSQSITFSGNTQLPLIEIGTGSSGLTTNVLTVTTNEVTFGNPYFGLPAESFNFSISGNTLTVTNWSVTDEASAMNGVFTRSQE